jgi:hypothetical protein
MTTNMIDPLQAAQIGDITWMQQESGWSNDKIARLCRLKVIPGAFQAQPNTQGSAWCFRKSKTLPWLRNLETK